MYNCHLIYFICSKKEKKENIKNTMYLKHNNDTNL